MIKRYLRKLGIGNTSLSDARALYADSLYLKDEQSKRRIYDLVKDQSMIGAIGILANIDAIDYIATNNIPGCIVECGVWKGGSMAAMLLRLIDQKNSKREVYLFDTFTGMTKPSDIDRRGDSNALEKYNQMHKDTHTDWCYASIDEVKKNISRTEYPEKQIHFIAGDVSITLPDTKIPEIALLRLDTDFYESTKAELEHLYQKVAKNGVVIVDDYGTWAGARKACDEYLDKLPFKPLMFRVDQCRRMFIKP